MRIGILTVPFNNNYGGLLQAYALKTVLINMGHEVIIINRRRNKPKGLKVQIMRFLISSGLVKNRYAEKIAEISVNTDLFKNKYLEPITEEYYSTRELKECLKLGIDCFIVGSDQVWRYKYAKDSIDDFYFSFLKGTDIPRFSYAASMGTDVMEYPDNKLKECSALLKEFVGVSVREGASIKLLSSHFGYSDAKLVLDPTMLLCAEEYKKFIGNRRPSEEPYLFTYILDDSEGKDTIIDNVAGSKSLARLNMKAQTGDLYSIKVIEPVEQWLSAIYYSDFVVTDSFHGTVFSILFNKPFLVIGNPERGLARVTDLLSRFGLESRLILRNETDVDVYNETIDWALVEQSLLKERKNSLLYINNALSKV